MRHLFLATLLLPLPALADEPASADVPPATEMPAAVLPSEDLASPASEAAVEAPQSVPSTPQAPVPEPPPSPLGFWSLRGFLNGGPIVLSQTPSDGQWRIQTGAVEIVLDPRRRQATIAGEPVAWPDLPLVPPADAPLQAGPEMPERGCRYWMQETPQGTHAWCWDAQGRPQRILTRQGEQWRLVFDATTDKTESQWRILRAVGR